MNARQYEKLWKRGHRLVWGNKLPIENLGETPYRTMAKVEVFPKEETPEEKEKRMEKERQTRNVVGVLAVATLPSVALLGIGVEWDRMNSGLAATSIIATIIMAAAVIACVGIKLDWFD